METRRKKPAGPFCQPVSLRKTSSRLTAGKLIVPARFCKSSFGAGRMTFRCNPPVEGGDCLIASS